MKVESTKRRGQPPFRAETQAEILRLYRNPRTTGRQVADQLHLNMTSVYAFLRRAGVVRPRGCTNNKLTPAQRAQLIKALPTTTDIALTRRYPLTRERVRQIRKQLGLPSSQVLQQAAVVQRQAARQAREHREREQARQRRAQHRQAAELPLINRVSDRWRAGASLVAVAQEAGVSKATMASRMKKWRERYPEKFPVRFKGFGPAWDRSLQKQWQAYWKKAVPDIDRLSRQWRAGVTIKQLARAMKISDSHMDKRIQALRRRYPTKFPRRSEMRNVRGGAGPV